MSGGFLRAKCSCGQYLAPVARMTHATLVVRRTCQGCKTKWLVKVVPLKTASDFSMHEATLTPVTP